MRDAMSKNGVPKKTLDMALHVLYAQHVLYIKNSLDTQTWFWVDDEWNRP